MKKIVYFVTVCLLALSSCSHDFDVYEGPAPEPAKKSAEELIKENAYKVFGVNFDPNQDWCSIVTGEVTINCDASVKKVQLLVEVKEIADDKATAETDQNDLRVLNEKETKGATTVKLKYDAPKNYIALYVGFQTDNSYYVQKVEGNSVSFDGTANSRMTRGFTRALPSGDFILKTVEATYREKFTKQADGPLFSLSADSYKSLKMASDDYTPNFKALFQTMVFTIFPNGRNDDYGVRINNFEKIKASGFYNETSYGYTTDGTPVIVTPVYKRDGAPNFGSEVYYSDLYYYYFTDEQYDAAPDKAAFLRNLPKFKAFPFSECYGESEDNFIQKRGSFALLYYGDGTDNTQGSYAVGLKGSFNFPANTKIGFMVRANTKKSANKNGECYLDGRLNDFINTDRKQNFYNSGLGATDPRAAWLNFNNHLLLCWESGTDSDFNDIIVEVTGLGGITPPPPVYPHVYTYCFEDTKENGDYDLNDLVLRAVRLDETHVKYSIIACGAWDELEICNINSPVIKGKEVHSLFGKQPKEFINTVNGSEYCTPVDFTVEVASTFSFEDDATKPYIKDLTTGEETQVALAGQSPFGILIPTDFLYPAEKVCIKDAYEAFNSWGTGNVTSTLWYVNSAASSSRVYSK